MIMKNEAILNTEINRCRILFHNEGRTQIEDV